MNDETARSLNELFQRLGVAADAGLGHLTDYYVAQAMAGLIESALAVLVLTVGAVTMLRWWKRDLGEIGYNDEAMARAVVTFVSVIGALIVVTMVAKSVSGAIVAMISPEGYALAQVLEALK